MEPPFSAVISLGTDCQAAYQIRRFFGQDRAFVFDWLVMTPAAVAASIRDGFRVPIEPGRLASHGTFVRDAVTGTRFHHDFSDPADFLASLATVAAKYAFLAARTAEAAAGDALFVLRTSSAGGARAVADALTDSVPGPWRLLVAHTAPMVFEHPRVVLSLLSGDPPATGSWRGNDGTWDDAFRAAASAAGGLVGDRKHQRVS
jgi:hypothetical protein